MIEAMKRTWRPIRILRNNLDFLLRRRIRWQRKGLRLKKQPASDLFSYLPAGHQQQALDLSARLIKEYHLQAFQADSSPVNFRENLFYLSMIENALSKSRVSLPGVIHAGDIGPSHWFYVQALYAALKWYGERSGRQVHLQGFEIDPYRVFVNLHSRYDHAIAHVRDLPGVDYVPRPFEASPGTYDILFQFFPFIFEEDHLQWGLPLSSFKPDQLLCAAWDSLKPGGILIIANQGEAEHNQQKRMLSDMGITPDVSFVQDPLLFRYDLDRFILGATRGR